MKIISIFLLFFIPPHGWACDTGTVLTMQVGGSYTDTSQPFRSECSLTISESGVYVEVYHYVNNYLLRDHRYHQLPSPDLSAQELTRLSSLELIKFTTERGEIVLPNVEAAQVYDKTISMPEAEREGVMTLQDLQISVSMPGPEHNRIGARLLSTKGNDVTVIKDAKAQTLAKWIVGVCGSYRTEAAKP